MKGLCAIGLAFASAGMAASAALAAGDAAVVATAPPTVTERAAPAGDPTGAQIQAWIHGDEDGSVDSGEGAEPDGPAPRQVHGEVSAGFGSNGYTSVGGVADIPVGQASDLVVAASRDSFGARGVRRVGQSLSVGLFLNGASASHRACTADARPYPAAPYAGSPYVVPSYAGPGVPRYGEPDENACATGAAGPAD